MLTAIEQQLEPYEPDPDERHVWAETLVTMTFDDADRWPGYILADPSSTPDEQAEATAYLEALIFPGGLRALLTARPPLRARVRALIARATRLVSRLTT